MGDLVERTTALRIAKVLMATALHGQFWSSLPRFASTRSIFQPGDPQMDVLAPALHHLSLRD
jgi:hypothetical protein